MDFPERERLLRRITLKKLYTTIKFDHNEIDVIFIDPSTELVLEADWEYNKFLKRNKGQIISLEDSYKQLVADGIWTEKMQDELQILENDLKKLRKQIPNLKYQKKEEKKVKETIIKIEKRIFDLELKKNSLYHFTIEYFAQQRRRRFLMPKITKVLSEIDSDLLYNARFIDTLSVYYFEDNAISTAKLRELARNDPWRLYWTASKESHIPLFPHSAIEMSDWQYLLVSWSKIYDFAFEHPNRPKEEIVNDDTAFDAWYANQIEALKNKVNTDNNDQIVTNIKGIGHHEVFIKADEEGAKEVIKLNNQEAMARIHGINKKIREKGEVKEIDLPDVQGKLRMEMNKNIGARR